MFETLMGWVRGAGEAGAAAATYDNATTALSWVILGVPAVALLYASMLIFSVLKAVLLIPAGRASRRAELAAWAAYYDKVDEKEALEAAVKAAKERHQADMKVALADPVLKRTAGQVYVAACQAEDKKVADFEQDEVQPAKKLADQATKDRRWYTMRTWRTEVMTS